MRSKHLHRTDLGDWLMMAAVFLCLLVLTTLSYGEDAAPITTAPVPTNNPTATTLQTGTPAEKAWTLGITAEQYMGYNLQNNSYTQFALDGTYKLGEAHSLRALLPAVKQYEIASFGENEFAVDDLYLYYYYTVAKDIEGISVKLRPGTTVPFSSKSRRDGTLSRPGLTVQISRKFFNEKLSVSYQPSVTYYLQKYKNTISGSPLRNWSLGHALLASYEIVNGLSAAVALQGAYHYNHQGQFAGPNPAQGTYSYEAYLGYEWDEMISFRLGHFQGDAFIKDGRYTNKLLDVDNSMFYMGMDIAL